MKSTNVISRQQSPYAELYFDGHTWRSNDLTAGTGATSAAAGGGLTSFFNSNGTQHVYYLDSNQHIHELFQFDNVA
jgi:hypothetical protein